MKRIMIIIKLVSWVRKMVDVLYLMCSDCDGMCQVCNEGLKRRCKVRKQSLSYGVIVIGAVLLIGHKAFSQECRVGAGFNIVPVIVIDSVCKMVVVEAHSGKPAEGWYDQLIDADKINGEAVEIKRMFIREL